MKHHIIMFLFACSIAFAMTYLFAFVIMIICKQLIT